MRLTAGFPATFDLQGHRGARGLAPENTIAGLLVARELGVRTVEVDVALTADGIPVLSHDPALDPDLTRSAGGGWLPGAGPLIAGLRFQDLAHYDVGRIRPGSAAARRFPDQRPADGAAIPSLAEALALDPGLRFNLELKVFPSHPHLTVPPAVMAEAVLAVIDAAGAALRVSIQSFDWRVPRHVRRQRPDIAVGWLTEPATVAAARRWWDGPHPEDFGGSIARAIQAEGGGHWAAEYAGLTPEQIAEARSLGLRLLPWTVNRASDMRHLIELGVDGLITDRPDIALGVIAEIGAEIRHGPPCPGLAHEIG